MQDHPDFIVSEKEGISAVWLIPVIALIFGVWLMIKTVVEQGFYVTVAFPNANGMVEGKTEVKYKGLPVGKVVDIKVSKDLLHVNVEIEMVAAAKELLNSNTKFWFVTADVSFQGVSGLDTLFSGGYINVQPDVESLGEPTRHFTALTEAPVMDQSTPGLHLILNTDTLGSIDKNSPVHFKQIQVGHVSGYKYDEHQRKVNIMVFIKPEFSHLVKSNSIFWNASGFEITGSLTSGLKIKTESLGAIISGGIAFDAPKFESDSTEVQNGHSFKMHSDYQTAEMGHEITLEIDWDAGIDRGSIIEYQGLPLGVIDNFSKIDPQEREIIASAKVNPRVLPYLTTETKFYVNAPEISLAGTTNMNTMFKGTRINLRPSLKGEPATTFKVFNHIPPYDYDEPGLHLTLQATNIGSLNVGTAIYFEQQKAGSVQAIKHRENKSTLVYIHIRPEFTPFINPSTRFWNTSGINIKGGLQGFEVDAYSVKSILAGGLSFGFTEDIEDKSENGDVFTLHPSRKVAQEKLKLTLFADTAKGLDTSTRIIYRGETIGSIHRIERDQAQVKLHVGVLPNYEFLLKTHSQFWVVRPKISLNGLADTDALFGGTYIGVSPGKGEQQSQFVLTQQPPAKHSSAQGLQLRLSSERGNIVNPGNPVSYRGILVGQVDNVALNEKGDKIDVNITIDDEYVHLITNHTRFYNASGITISGGFGNLSLKTESADAILRGGISFFNPESITDTDSVTEGAEYALFESFKHAEMAGIAIKIYFSDITGLHDNLKLKYKQHQVGAVSRIVFNKDTQGATVYAFLNDDGKKFAAKHTQFWLVQAELGLFESNNVNAILEGGYIGVHLGAGEPTTDFIASDIAPVITELANGLNLKLLANKLGSVRVGNPVLYRQVKVGKVIGVDLASSANKVNIYVNIAKRYKNLVTADSQFWNTSGLKVDAGIFSGVNIDSESIESIVTGGIAFATPDADDNTPLIPVSQGHNFVLNDNAKEDWHKWAPIIELNSH